MNANTDNLITVLDAGSSKSCVLVAEVVDRALRYRGHGIEVSRGMRRGVISDLGPAAKAINAAALTAERSTKAPIETGGCWDWRVAYPGDELAGRHQYGQPDERDHARGRAVSDRPRALGGLAPDREVLHLLPQQFIPR